MPGRDCHWQLEHTFDGGANLDYIYSLIFEKTAVGWKVVLDHFSAIHPTANPVTSQ
ncbi:ketosteroid isomerase-like protein [Granulicella aggregans]|uniref:Ketosteroid isomerase-like protein n=1 Tax=Granulicella aggregans TaxID=474949 RepID=A0A7W8E7A6_9BACT|nr:ketosteroid isomerase-like protein [Granulicella aggregans]